MLSLYKLSRISADRVSHRVKKSSKSTNDFIAVYTNPENLTYDDRLIDACRKSNDNPKGVNKLLFIALPDRFLSKITYLSYGKDLDTSSQPAKENVELGTSSLLNSYRLNDRYTEFYNIETPEILNHIENVLLCSGLSPIEDSILLLCELGRVFRVSKILNKPIKVMLADTEWMSSNRTIRQFKSLNDEVISKGLINCRDKRGKLYTRLNIEVDLKQIANYSRKDSINAEKLNKISKYYLDLCKVLWGDSTGKPLAPYLVSLISKPLDRITVIDDFDSRLLIPEHIKVLSNFPNVLKAIDDSLNEHLQIIRTIAKQFNSFDEDIFSYFFAQYYAQDKYRGTVLKIAPISESKFDKPFDELDKYFKTWGEGHTTKDLLLSGIKDTVSPKKISAIYLPHYQNGNYKLLPYTPLSLDVVKKEEKDHNILYKDIILIDFQQDTDTIKIILKETPLLERNRLLSDLVWFLLFVSERLEKDFRHYGLISNKLQSFSSLLGKINPMLKEIYEHELKYTIANKISTLWETWLSKIQEESEITYIPLHIYFLLMENEDWNEIAIDVATKIIKDTIEIYNAILKD